MAAFHEWYDLSPEHFEGSSDRPLFVMPDGKVLGRAAVQADFCLAARAFDLPEDHIGNIGTHSCRVSCAT